MKQNSEGGAPLAVRIHLIRERRVDKKSLENKQVYRKSGDFQKQSVTKQTKRVNEW